DDLEHLRNEGGFSLQTSLRVEEFQFRRDRVKSGRRRVEHCLELLGEIVISIRHTEPRVDVWYDGGLGLCDRLIEICNAFQFDFLATVKDSATKKRAFEVTNERGTEFIAFFQLLRQTV